MALIEIDSLPINKMVILHGELLVITRWCFAQSTHITWSAARFMGNIMQDGAPQ